jgi:uncharacterized delta-60 repeat protein
LERPDQGSSIPESPPGEELLPSLLELFPDSEPAFDESRVDADASKAPGGPPDEETKKKLEELKEASFPAGMTYEISYDVSNFLDASIEKVLHTLFEAFVLVSLVVFLFLNSWRSTVITGLALVLATAPAARTAPGDLDPTFGGDGIVRTDLTPAEDDGFAVAIQPDGKIVVGGVKGNGGPNPRFAIVRYETDGSVDPSFGGGDRKVSIDFTPGADFVFIVRIQTNGKIVVAGPAAYFGGKSRFALARLASDGSLDPTFGGDGKVMTDITPSYDVLNGMALQPNGKIVLVGSVSAGSRNGKIGVLRYRSDGSLDPAFGGDGMVFADPTPTFDDGLAIGVESDGQIIVAGGAGFDGPNERFYNRSELEPYRRSNSELQNPKYGHASRSTAGTPSEVALPAQKQARGGPSGF